MSPSKKALRLPYILAPFKVAVILPNKTQPETMAFAQDVISRLSQISSLEDDIFVDDRLDNSIGRRLLAAANLGRLYLKSLKKNFIELQINLDKIGSSLGLTSPGQDTLAWDSGI